MAKFYLSLARNKFLANIDQIEKVIEEDSGEILKQRDTGDPNIGEFVLDLTLEAGAKLKKLGFNIRSHKQEIARINSHKRIRRS